MSKIELRYLFPLHDQVLLLIFDDKQINKRGVVLIPNRESWFMPYTKPEQLNKSLLAENGLVTSWEHTIEELWPNNLPKTEVVKLEMDEQLYTDACRWCNAHGISLEPLVQAFFLFTGYKENHDIAVVWLRQLIAESTNPSNIPQPLESIYTEGTVSI